MAADRNRLRQRIFPEIEYTVHDEIVSQLLQVIVCPITNKISDNNVIFHHQCYDKDAWNQHVETEKRNNRYVVRRGSRRPGDTKDLKCPHTGGNFSIDEALRKVHEVLDRRKMRILFEERVDLRPREWQRFTPNAASVTANEFSAHILNLIDLSKERRLLYDDYVANRRSVAVVNPLRESEDPSSMSQETLRNSTLTTPNETSP